MSFWLTTQVRSKIAVKAMMLTFMAITAVIITALPVFADTTDAQSNIVVYDNREKTLKITEISFTHDFTSMSVLVENIQTKTNFRIEHVLDNEDTINEYIEITATDGMGNESEMVNIKNPFYLPEIVEPTPEPEAVKGSLNVAGSTEKSSESEADSKDNKVSNEKSAFDTNGWATVVDNADTSSKEFFIVRSETGNEFYIVIDRENGKDNVYFLNSVTEWDLLGLTEKYEVPNNLNPNSDLNNIVGKESTTDNTAMGETEENSENENVQSKTDQDEEVATEMPKQGGVGLFSIIILILFVSAVGAYFYFIKFKRKTHIDNNNDSLPDNYGDYDEDDEDDNNIKSDYDDDDEEDYEEDYKETESTSEEATTTLVIEPTEKPSHEQLATDVGDITDDVVSTDDDVGDNDYGENDVYDDYREEVDEDDVLGSIGGDEYEEEDKTI